MLNFGFWILNCIDKGGLSQLEVGASRQGRRVLQRQAKYGLKRCFEF